MQRQSDVQNQRTPSIINIMIVSVFGGGDYTIDSQKNFDPIIFYENGHEHDQGPQYQTALTLLAIVVILVPLMLCVKPCIALCSKHEEEDDEIEFTNINRGAEE